ncbi:translation initiation factor IF-6 [Candidatus Marsarchaeota archaeon]|nr:translation initiation factor IF-6 [Candidatus Marsarchaeota archaeon]MCL5404949.1 translation initiation factor IF-6 [Candidatus Marsarchaeota archaeon]
MPIIKYSIHDSGYVGAYATATDSRIFVGSSLNKAAQRAISGALNADCIPITIGMSDLIGVFSRANSNGMVLSNVATDMELANIKKNAKGMNIGIIKSGLNAIGNNILANDKIAIVHPGYDSASIYEISDALGVEAIRYDSDSFKTVGASNVLTNKGILINNKSTDADQEFLDKATGMSSMRSTANTGALSIGLSVIANSYGIVAGSDTTGFELARIAEALNIE